ncbi:ferric-chelate reductase [Pseudohyphozyma bogoriensis]|nr:ferric-chelate reductase [Pseudohyphozyma bogoriensis]
MHPQFQALELFGSDDLWLKAECFYRLGILAGATDAFKAEDYLGQSTMATPNPASNPTAQDFLNWNNLLVPLWLYVGILSSLVIFGTFHFIERKYEQHCVRKWNSRYRPSDDLPGGATSAGGGGATRWEWKVEAWGAWWRKVSHRCGKVSEKLGMGSPAQLGAILLYYLLNLAIALFGADGTINYQAHHCARLFSANMPLVVALAARELSWISWITGFSHDTLNVFHRWVARFTLVLALVHAGGRVYVNKPAIDLSLAQNAYQSWGVVSLVFFCYIVVFSIRFFRNLWYTTFIISHIILFMLVLIALAVHYPPAAPFAIAGLIFYALDRIVRGVSLVYYSFFKSVGPGEAPSASVQILSNDTIKLSLKVAKPWAPGQHTFLHAPILGPGGHPFSIASTYLPVTHLSNDPPPPSGTKTLIIRVRSGITKALYDEAIKNAASGSDRRNAGSRFLTTPVWPVWCDGPYGEVLKLHHHERALLFVGGSGVSFAVPLMLDLVRRARSMTMGGKRIVTKRLTVVWSVKEESHIEWIGTELRDAMLHAPVGFLDLRIHVTSTPASIAPSLFAGGSTLHPSNSVRSISTFNTVDTFDTLVSTEANSVTNLIVHDYGAPLSPSVVNIEMLDSKHGGPLTPRTPRSEHFEMGVINGADYSDSVCVGACGPLAMTKSVGDAVADAIDPVKVALGEHRRNVLCHLELFGW